MSEQAAVAEPVESPAADSIAAVPIAVAPPVAETSPVAEKPATPPINAAAQARTAAASGPAKPARRTAPKSPDKIVMHWLRPVKRAPAPHMVSGEPSDNRMALRTLAQAIGNPIGNPGMAFAPACNPKLVTNETHRGTGEHWALLTVVNGEMVIPPSACPECMALQEWQDAIMDVPHPQYKAPVEEEAAASGCC